MKEIIQCILSPTVFNTSKMKLLTSFTAIIAAAAAGQMYVSQPAEDYASSAEAYQSALEYQQQGLYSDQSHAYSGQGTGADQLHAYSGQNTGHSDQSHVYSGQGGGHSRPTGEKTARILNFVSESNGHGYHYAYETENGIKAQEVGQTAGHEKGTEARGAYSYTGDDGQVYTVTYTADENGFHAQGAHLPTPPPMPEAIARSLEQNAKDEAAGIYDNGNYIEQHQSHHQQHNQQEEHHEQTVGSVGHQHQQAAQAFQYEANANQYNGGFQPGYQNLNLPVESYHKH